MSIADGSRPLRIALVGNPNSGKSTIFNHLTGLRQRTGNFPGVTVEIKKGQCTLPSGREVSIIDLPGTYSLYPSASDERIVATVLTNPSDKNFPDALLYVADSTHLEKHFLLFSQLLDLGLPMVLALNMADAAADMGLRINAQRIGEQYGVPVQLLSGRTGENMPKLRLELDSMLDKMAIPKPFYTIKGTEKEVSDAIGEQLGVQPPYRSLLLAQHASWLPFLSESERGILADIADKTGFQALRTQVDETLERFDAFTPVVHEAVQRPPVFPSTATDSIDNVLTHRVFGPMLFVGVMLLVFEAIFRWSTYPMDAIKEGFAWMQSRALAQLGHNWFSDLLTDGIMSGLSGILVFVPQIAILFLLVTILEEVGYMARVVFMFDKGMRRFGMNGRSIVSLIGGGACAVPAIMSTRSIGNWQERLITVMVTPFISCSARLPVYSVLIGLFVPARRVLGVVNLQSLVFMGMYALGIVTALGAGFLMKKVLRTREPSYLAIELPVYRKPHWKNVWLTVWEKVRAFVAGAGKIIIVISMVLWALSHFGPGDSMAQAAQNAHSEAVAAQMDSTATKDLLAARQLEASWAGLLGKTIEPAIRPLGYDWKIGIALLASFAAREVFVGTMSTIYSIGSSEDETDLQQKMREDPIYSLATALSLLVFYALAMQCMSTVAVVKRETGSWRWAIFQFIFMCALAYLAAWLVYSVFA
jgi:ferrous iron transport protein B